jgi:tetratricopeptide (TPR) repeat protein
MTETGIEFKKNVYKAYDFFKKENSAKKAALYIEELLREHNSNDRGLTSWLGLVYLESGEYEKARETFLTIDEYYQAGYCELLTGDIESAKALWLNCKPSEVKAWSRCFSTLLEGYLSYEPTFLNIRNHLEVDIGYLLRANQLKFAENILNLIDDLANINLESYKFAGRALLHNGFRDLSVNFLIQGQKVLPNDPEVYYHLGQYSLAANASKEAEQMFKHCLLISPSYTPAKDRLKEMKKPKSK